MHYLFWILSIAFTMFGSIEIKSEKKLQELRPIDRSVELIKAIRYGSTSFIYFFAAMYSFTNIRRSVNHENNDSIYKNNLIGITESLIIFALLDLAFEKYDKFKQSLNKIIKGYSYTYEE